QIGCVELTAVVHPDSAQTQLWAHRIIKAGGSDLQWPDDTGGRATLEGIKKLAQNPTEAAKAQLDLHRTFAVLDRPETISRPAENSQETGRVGESPTLAHGFWVRCSYWDLCRGCFSYL